MSISILEKMLVTHSHVYPYIVQVGTGGTGGYLVQHIAQLLGTSKTPASYVIVDPDIIEEKNLGNQLFLSEEVGLRKADVLANRYSAAYGIDIGSYSESFIESVDELKKLFSTEYLRAMDSFTRSPLFLPIVIGCVDNHFTRKILHEFYLATKPCVYIDAGNESTKVPSDWQVRPKSNWTPDEIEQFNDSGWSGQVVIGAKFNSYEQKPAAEVFPDILTDDDHIRPSELSCTELSASDPQRLVVNKFAALIILNALTEIVEEATISTHLTFFHAKKGYMRSVSVEEEKEEEPLNE